MRKERIEGDVLTLGLAPAWDLACYGTHLAWGAHAVIKEQTIQPAGKALNVSRTLAWLGLKSTATGLWGREDIDRAQRLLGRTAPLIETDWVPVPGSTRTHVTLVDTAASREMHLRSQNALVSREALRTLTARVAGRMRHQDLCVLASALPGAELTEPLLALCRACGNPAGARLVVDSHGPLFQRIVTEKLACLIAPNVQELEELVGRSILDTPRALVAAAREVLDSVETVLVSRGEEGALLVTPRGAWQGRCHPQGKVLSTVGCGDALLAGFIAAIRRSLSPRLALGQAVRVATAQAWGWCHAKTWAKAKRGITVQVERV